MGKFPYPVSKGQLLYLSFVLLCSKFRPCPMLWTVQLNLGGTFCYSPTPQLAGIYIVIDDIPVVVG